MYKKDEVFTMTKRFAFTLAEVLIALAIIGVVAAMTIPTFMANTAGAQFKTGLKKGITVLTQAASANYATEGYNFAGTNGAYGATATTSTPAPNYSTNAVAEADRIIGFNTENDTESGSLNDRHPEAPSLFHLFKNNLSLKNSSELSNYAVMPVDITLNCTSTDGGTLEIPGTSENPTVSGVKTGALSRATIVGGAGIQVGGGINELCAGSPLSGSTGGINQGYMFQLEDGMVFTYDPAQAYCTEANPCFGYIDINGNAGPNRVIACSEGGGNNAWIHTYGRNADAGNLLADCTVDAKDITDIYPVLFYGSTVKPASRAAKSVLYSKKSNQQAAANPPAGGGS